MSCTANSLCEAVLWDGWPGLPTIVDYGIATQKHYEAYYFPIRKGEVTAEQLHIACLKGGDALTQLVRGLPSNPHKDIQISNPYPIVGEEDWEENPPEFDNPYPIEES